MDIPENWIEIGKLIVQLIVPLVSVFLASLYFQGIQWKKEKTYSYVNQIYLDNGLHKIESCISTYGTSTILAISDIRGTMIRLKNDENMTDILGFKLEEIKSRKYVSNLIRRDYGSGFEAMPRLITFGKPLYNAIKRTLYIYSKYMDQLTDLKRICSEDIELLLAEDRGLKATFVICQDIEMYLERRLRQLSDFILIYKYNNYKEFLEIVDDERFLKFIQEIEDFSNLLNEWDVATEKNRPDASKKLSKWLSENINKNPLFD